MGEKAGELYVVGIGPGKSDWMTLQAQTVLEACDVIVGYTVYVNLIKEVYPNKTFLTTPMRQEIERCKLCFEKALDGNRVAMICSGDAGVYGMASPVLELSPLYPSVEVTIVPGITAALSGAALLGAPIAHDFAVISLSDLLTPMDVIMRRIHAAVEGDFVLCLYNPASKKRADYLKRVCLDIMKQTGPDRICGFVRNIAREGEMHEICTIKELSEKQVDMFTTVFIGNSNTKHMGDYMVTPRGYLGPDTISG